MKLPTFCRSIAVLVFATLTFTCPSPAPAAGSAPLAVRLGPGSVLWLEGTSTVHDFSSTSKAVEIELTRDSSAAQPADAAALMALIRSSGVHTVLVRVPVLTLKSDKAALDKNLRKAMRAEEHPSVTFQLKEYELKPRAAADDTVALEAEGSLSVAGQERAIKLDARAYRAAEGVWLEGSERLEMSDYGIKPPTMMLGMLKVADPITVKYRLLLIPSSAGTSSSK